jgi:glutamate synthase (NADPH/NADH) small chain
VEAEEVEWKNIQGQYRMDVKPDTSRHFKAELVLLAMGFTHTAHEGLVSEFALELDSKGNIKTNNYRTSNDRVFAAGDAISGASLVVNAIASGRKAAAQIDKYLGA